MIIRTKKRDGSLASLSDCISTEALLLHSVRVRLWAHASRATLFFLRSVMGQACSCLQHRRKLERRASDESTLHDTDGDFDSETSSELDILIDGSSGGGSSNSNTLGEADELLGTSGRLRQGGGVFTKRNSKTMHVDADDESEQLISSVSITSMATLEAEDQLQSHNSSSARLLGQKSGDGLSPEKNLDVLRSYQKATGVVR